MSVLKEAKQIIIQFKEYNKVAVVFGVIAIWNVIGFLPPLPGVLYYVLLGFGFLYNFMSTKGYNIAILSLLIYIPINILFTNPLPVFKPWDRFALFALLLGSVSALFTSDKDRFFRNSLLNVLLKICLLLGTGSAICFYLGINYMALSNFAIIHQVGLFGGLTRHSMLLGPIASFGAIYALYLYYRSKKKLYIACCAINTLAVLFSASRASLAGVIFGLVVLIYRQSKNLGSFFKYSLIILAILAVTFPIWSDSLSYVIAKNDGMTEEISLVSREDKWDNRIAEFSSHPIFGVGFVSVDTNIESAFNSSTGTVETGSSWLSIPSMTGIIGTIIMLIIIIKSYLIAKLNIYCNKQASLIEALLCFFYIHMMAEGFIFSGGSFLCLMFWLFVGCAYDMKNQFPRIICKK